MTKYISISVALMSVVLFVGIDSAHAQVSKRVGYAYDKQTGKFLYSETHSEVTSNGQLMRDTVVYRDDAGKVFAEKHIDFQKNLVMPDFHLVNVENGHVEGVRRDGERWNVHFRLLSKATEQEASLDTPRNGIIDAGFDRFIEQNWASLVDGEVLEREFLIPSQLDFYTFEIERYRDHQDRELAFRLRVKSIFLQLFVPPVLVYYDPQTRSLLRYEGISNIRDNNGRNFHVRIEFDGVGPVEANSES